MEKLSLDQKIFKIQQEIESIPKDSKGFNYKYASLDVIHEKLKPLLIKYNLYTRYELEGNKIKLVLTCLENPNDFRVSFISMNGLFEQPHYAINDKGKEVQTNMDYPQQMGSMITYFRRYLLVCMFDLLTDDDVDGKTSAKSSSKTQSDQKEYTIQYPSATSEKQETRTYVFKEVNLKDGTKKKLFELKGSQDKKDTAWEGTPEYDGISIQIKKQLVVGK